MTRRLCAIVLVWLLVVSSGGAARGQNFDERGDDSLVAHSPEVALEVNEPTDVTFSLTSESLQGFGIASYLQQGQVYSSVDFAMLSVTDKAFQTNGDFTTAPRFQLGWESERGFGVRGRYWEFEDSIRASQVSMSHSLAESGFDTDISSFHVDSYGGIIAVADGLAFHTGSIRLSAQESSVIERDSNTLDLDIYQRFQVRDSAILLGTGLKTVSSARYVELLYEQFGFGDTVWYAGEVAEERISGLGPTLVAEWYHPLVTAETWYASVLVNGRTSYIPADFEVTSELLHANYDDNLWINEGSVGLETVRQLRSLTLRIRTLLETQYWASDVTDDQAFTGASVSLGFDW